MSNFVLAMEPPPSLLRLLASNATGAGADMTRVEERVRELREDYGDSSAITYREAALIEVFHQLATEWRAATRFQSSLVQAANHPAYRAIVQLGTEVVPVLLRELQRQPQPWFLALRELTGADPVGPRHRGNVRAIADAWLHWGRDRGLI